MWLRSAGSLSHQKRLTSAALFMDTHFAATFVQFREHSPFTMHSRKVIPVRFSVDSTHSAREHFRFLSGSQWHSSRSSLRVRTASIFVQKHRQKPCCSCDKSVGDWIVVLSSMRLNFASCPSCSANIRRCPAAIVWWWPHFCFSGFSLSLPRLFSNSPPKPPTSTAHD